MTITSSKTSGVSGTEALRLKQRKYIRKLAAIQAGIDTAEPAAVFVPEVGEQVDALVNGQWVQVRVVLKADPETGRPAVVRKFGGPFKLRFYAREFAPAGSKTQRCSEFAVGQCVDVLSVLDGTTVYENLCIRHLTTFPLAVSIGRTDHVVVLIKGKPTCIPFHHVYPLGWFMHGRHLALPLHLASR